MKIPYLVKIHKPYTRNIEVPAHSAYDAMRMFEDEILPTLRKINDNKSEFHYTLHIVHVSKVTK